MGEHECGGKWNAVINILVQQIIKLCSNFQSHDLEYQVLLGVLPNNTIRTCTVYNVLYNIYMYYTRITFY